MVRPWVGGLGILLCALAWLGVLAWRAEFNPAGVYEGLARAAAAARLEGIAIALHLEAADSCRRQVHKLRAQGTSRAELKEARCALADQLKAASLILWREGEVGAASGCLDAAAKAAPERLDLKCLLIHARVETGQEPDLRLALLRLAYRHDAACALYLLGRMFLEDDRPDEATAYLERAAEKDPRQSRASLLLAEMQLRQNDRAGALASASQAYDNARSLGERLAAVALIERAGGRVPPRAALIAEACWQRYRYLALTLAALAVFLFHPAIGGFVRRRRGKP